MVSGSASKRTTRSVAADDALLQRYHATREPGDLEALVRRFQPLAHGIVRKYRRGRDAEDLLQVARLGLVKAIEGFDPDRGAAFPAYAVPTIAGEVKRHFRDHGWGVRPPRGIHDRILQVDRAVQQLWGELGRSPTPREVAHAVGCTLEDVMEAFEASATAREPASLDAPVAHGPDSASVAESVGAEDSGYAAVEHRATLAVLMRGLPPREREILRLRFAEGLTQQEIGTRVGLSQMHVSRLLRRTLADLRAAAARG